MTKKARSPIDSFTGFDLQLYCWIRQHRILCAIHKSLYYDFDHPLLDDAQYDRLEKTLLAVEARHPDISTAVSLSGYRSPNDYVGSVRMPDVLWRAELYIKENPDLTAFEPIHQTDTPDTLYEATLPRIQRYPI